MAACLVVIVLAAMEFISFIGVEYLLKPAKPHYFADDYKDYVDGISDHEIESYVQAFFDPVLGWDFHKGHVRPPLTNSAGQTWSYHIDALGSRTNPYESDRVLISLFGDSFTFGDEVSDHQSWQYHLSRLTDSRVLNFGVGAYGTDQAVLKLENKLKDGFRTKYVVLGIWDENIRRIMSAYRGFYFYRDPHVLGFKPVFRGDGDTREWIVTAPEDPRSRDSIERAFDRAKEFDFYYRSNEKRPVAEFPYVVSLVRFVAYTIRVDVFGQEHLLKSGGTSDAMWRYDAARARMAALVDRFVALGEQYEFQPVLVFFPDMWTLRPDAPGTEPEYRAFAREMRDRHASDGLILIDVLEHDFDRSRFNITPYAGHASDYGNRVVAGIVFDSIKNEPEFAGRHEIPALFAATPEPASKSPPATVGKVCNRVVADWKAPDLLNRLKPENARIEDGSDRLVLVAANDDPILLLPPLDEPVEVIEIDLEVPGDTQMELFVITRSRGYTEEPYRQKLRQGPNSVSIHLAEDDISLLRLDPGSLVGTYALTRLVLRSECAGR